MPTIAALVDICGSCVQTTYLAPSVPWNSSFAKLQFDTATNTRTGIFLLARESQRQAASQTELNKLWNNLESVAHRRRMLPHSKDALQAMVPDNMQIQV